MQDVRIALRNLRTRPGFTLVAVLTLALGIGANTAVFTVVNAVLLQALPYEDPSRVVVLTEQTPQFPSVSATRYNYDDWRARSQSFTGVGAVRATSLTISGGSEPERVPAKMISATLLPVLGVTSAEGRGFDERDDKPGAEGVVLLADGFARRHYPEGGAVGQRLLLDNQPYTVIGVLPARFELFQPADLYVPFGPWAATLPEDRGWHPGIFPVARLRSGVSLEAARSELQGISLAARAGVPRIESQRARHGDAAAGSGRAERPAGAAPAAGRGRAGAAHRLRQRGQPAAGAGRRPPEGDGHPHRGRRRTRAPRPPAGCRERGAVERRRAPSACWSRRGACRCSPVPRWPACRAPT